MELNPPTPWLTGDWDLLVRLCGAAVAGLLLGVDRQVRGHGAGLRTHAIICFASALVTVAALALYFQLGEANSEMDPLRVIEGTATMVGVIAGALIVFSKGEVKNLTTAAHLWLAGAIGIAFGAGLYPLALLGTVMAVLLLTLFGWIERNWIERAGDGES